MIFSFVTVLWLALLHPFYVSVTEVTLNPRTQAVEVSCRMFYDDLERELNRINHAHINIVKPADKALANRLVADYVKKHLELKADGKLLNLNFVGYEIQEDGAWAYFEAKGIGKIKNLAVHDELLYTAHPEQINMIHATVNGERKSTKLDNPEADAVFGF